jgi:hypothetical protein
MAVQQVRVAKDVIYQRLQDEMVLLDLTSQRYFGLDDVGCAMWGLLLEHGDAEIVADRMCAEYDVDRSVALVDIEALIGRLMELGLLVRGS